MDLRFDHLVLFALGDFDRDAALAGVALAVRALGPRLAAFGTASAAAKKTLLAREIDVDSLGRSRKKAIVAVDGMFGVWDAIVVSSGWPQDHIEGILAQEREQAFLDVRVPRPVLRLADPEYRFLSTPNAWARFLAARAAGAKPDQAKEFARQDARGHKTKDRNSGGGRGHSPAKTRTRIAR